MQSSTKERAEAPPTPRLGAQAGLAMGSAGAAAGVIANGITYFLLLYDSQVLGLAPAMAGAAMGLSLVFDAVSDPLVGAWSDRLHSRFGRRHPFMFASFIPVAVFYYLLWSPPVDASNQPLLFAYLLGITVLMRTSLTLFDVPMNALIPEFTNDYDERTRLFNYRVSATWVFGTAMAVVMFAYWIADSPEFPDGSMNARGYIEAGAWGAIFFFVAAAVAVFGTTVYIPRLRQPPERTRGLWKALAEYRETLSDPSFLAIIGSRIVGQSAAGAAAVLWLYIQSYIWRFDSDQLMWLMVCQMLAPLPALFATPRLARRRDKKPLMIGLSLAFWAVSLGPVSLHSLGLFPSPGDPVLFPLMLVIGGLQVTFVVMVHTLGASMLSDVVESREVVTSRREEGVLVAFQTFIFKSTSGLGAWVAGLLLAFIAFPLQAAPSEVPDEALFNLALIYGPVLSVLYLVSIGILFFYRIDRATHEANLETLAARRESAAGSAAEK